MARYVRFRVFGKTRWGLWTEQGVQPLSGGPFDGVVSAEGSIVPWDAVQRLPCAVPSKIVCIGRNFVAHAAELGHDVPSEPLMFLKAPSALLADGGQIVTPDGQSELVHHEGELAMVMGRRARHVGREDAHRYVLGYTMMNDVTARDLQRRDVQFTRAKSFDTFAPLGPWLDTDFVPRGQRLSVHVNGALRQDGSLDRMIFPPAQLVEAISRVMTLEPGDVISTGTPAGVGPLRAGDVVEVAIEGLGVLQNSVMSDVSHT